MLSLPTVIASAEPDGVSMNTRSSLATVLTAMQEPEVTVESMMLTPLSSRSL